MSQTLRLRRKRLRVEDLVNTLTGEGEAGGLPPGLIPRANSYYATWIDPPAWVREAEFVEARDGLRFYKAHV